MQDRFNLSRFVEAQNGVYSQVEQELRAGRKRTHWMWYIFPQLAGLGSSPMAQHYAIASLDEARAYLAHSVLGPRLTHCTALACAVPDRTAHAIFGSPDDLKFCSAMTLFAYADNAGPFNSALTRFFGGREDSRTLELLRTAPL